ncbi:MAG: YifB family Mg chelatase-like AAA ATPase [Lachnospiraceae bacterium]|nr:YifB family Mg chelatase-like AAA ATPase [Lachnospiraceae bacterium]
MAVQPIFPDTHLKNGANMYNSIISATLIGIEAHLVNVEVDMSEGIPFFDMTGFLTTEVKEAGSRVKTAIKNSGFLIPPARITVNISPANIRKSGTGFDLPIAIALLINMGILNEDNFNNSLVVGEISLGGKIGPIKGILPIILEAKKRGINRFIIPKDNYYEAKMISDIYIIPVESIRNILEIIYSENTLNIYEDSTINERKYDIDFSDIKGCKTEKRASLISACGLHNILYVGAPGVGKTMLAKRLLTILPILSYEEKLEVASIYSIVGMNDKINISDVTRPFRNPHHSISMSGLIGGGKYPIPGEISLAHKGILFLDELTEFMPRSLDALRQPLEDKKIVLSRTYGKLKYPADFMLVGAMNPCQCGYYPDRNKCHCSDMQIKRYMGRISKAFIDRIDICVAVDGKNVLNESEDEYSSEKMAEMVDAAVKIQKKRYKDSGFTYNSQLSAKEIKKYCEFEMGALELLDKFFAKSNFEMRTAHKTIKVAQTIADLAKDNKIRKKHISEALNYRME